MNRIRYFYAAVGLGLIIWLSLAGFSPGQISANLMGLPLALAFSRPWLNYYFPGSMGREKTRVDEVGGIISAMLFMVIVLACLTYYHPRGYAYGFMLGNSVNFLIYFGKMLRENVFNQN